MFSWFRKRRRQRLRSAPFPPAWVSILEANVRHYGYLPPADQEKLRRRVQVFVGEKHWVECGGLEIDDEVRVTIAGQACLLLLGISEEYCFDRVKSVLVYPGPYTQPSYQHAEQAVVFEEMATQGQAWRRGPIVLSWQHVLLDGRDPHDGRNLVLHEFAHHLDDLDGALDGMPPLGSAAEARRWSEVLRREYQRLREAAGRGRITLLDQYGATNPAEFFAVSVECFFERPGAFRRRHPELYAELRKFFGQDPEAWYGADRLRNGMQGGGGAAATVAEDAEAEVRRNVEQMGLRPESADGLFAAGVLHAHHDRHQPAVANYTAALELTPNDAEIYRHRAESLLQLGHSEEALADCDTAVELDPQDIDAYRTRAAVHQRRGSHEAAVEDWSAVLALDVRQRDVESRYRRAAALATLRRYREALEDLNRAIRHDPTQGRFYRTRSEVYRQLGLLREADADQEEAVRRGIAE